MDKLPTAEAWVGTEIGTTSSIRQNSLTGSSSLTVSEKNWIKISGSWVGKAAPGDTVHRYAGGKVGANSTGLHHWSPGSLKFKESAIASPWSLEVA
jgi:hypothetical protein